jgi:large subunit ribosomal protein L41
MFKPSQPMMARLRLTTKQVNGGYYKGNRTGSMGYFAKNGSYIIDWKKVRTYVVPENLDQFKVGVHAQWDIAWMVFVSVVDSMLTHGQLTPFVTNRMTPTKGKYTREIEKDNGDVVIVERAFGGKDFLDLWASDNGREVLEQERIEKGESTEARQ